MNRILVITDEESDLSTLLRKHCDTTVISTDSISFNIDNFDSLCILAGNEASALNPSAVQQSAIEKMRKKGKPVFCEFLGSLGAGRTRGNFNTAHQRMVYYGNGFDCNRIQNGDLLDGQVNDCIKFEPKGENSLPILTYQEYICAHTSIEITQEKHKEGIWALWWYDSNTLVSSIRLCNFHRARFAPQERWKAIISSIISFLAGETIEINFDAPVCTYQPANITRASDADAAVGLALGWITDADMLKNGGEGGVYEGFFSRINARTGAHHKNKNIRTDCSGEIGGALLFDSLLTGNEASAKSAKSIFKFIFDFMQVKDTEHSGMLRWSEAAWETCFQDDAARAIIPLLLCQHFDIDVPYLDNVKAALDYMLSTTGADGIRVACTEIFNTPCEKFEKLQKENGTPPCAHFNAFYHAALLLAYRVCKKNEYFECALRGLSTLMSAYPQTRRETSETEENCRLIFPLAVLYGITKKQEHYDWLCKVTDELEKRRHKSGGYAEWDTDYQAACSRNHKGECALLANNGDPVADLLYSNNWLPLGFSYAYFVTGEKRFYDLWTNAASFAVSSQMHSEYKHLNGAWARAFDMDSCENYGIPHDLGWGPLCIESGWTVGEIIMGLQFMKLAEKKHNV